MSKRGWAIAGLVAVAAVAGVTTRGHWWPQGAVAQGPAPAARAVPVEVATAVKRAVPVKLEALGTVQPLASVAIKARVETTIVNVHFADGAWVNQGDLLFTLDSRSVEAQIRQTEGALTAAKAQLEQADRDLQRYTGLLAKNASTQVAVNNAATQVNVLQATVTSQTASLDSLRVQLDHHTIRAAIAGRISVASVKAGNFVRPADVAPLATIVQTKPVYVTFGLPQRFLPPVRQALQRATGHVEATAPGEGEPSVGRLAMVDNTVDPTTGMLPVRAVMDNADEALWPGTLVRVVLTLRTEDAVTIPSAAVQTGQSGTYVFVVVNGAAEVKPVTIDRTSEGESIVSAGLSGGETVVTDGQLLLTNGTKVAPRQRKAGA